MAERPSSSGRKAKLPEPPHARFATIKLKQVQSTGNERPMAWAEECGYVTAQCPSVHAEALSYLQLMSPMIVVRSGDGASANRAYTLVGGRRTFQLHSELLTGEDKIRVIVISNAKALPDAGVFDNVIQRILYTPDRTARAMVVAQLVDNENLRERAGAYISMETTSELCTMFGLPKATLYKEVALGREVIAHRQAPPAGARSRLPLLDQSDPDEPADTEP